MEQIVAEPQGDQPRKTITKAVAEVVQSRTFRRLLTFARPPWKILGLLLHFKFRKYVLDLAMRSQGGTTAAEDCWTGGWDERTEIKGSRTRDNIEVSEVLEKSTSDMHNLIQGLINFNQVYPPLNWSVVLVNLSCWWLVACWFDSMLTWCMLHNCTSWTIL
jgi:hypothetical protein